MLKPKTRPKSKRRPSPKGFGAPVKPVLDLQDGDRLHFLSDSDCEVRRGETVVGRHRYAWDEEAPLGKAVQRTQMALVPGMEAKVAGPNKTSMGKPDSPAPAPGKGKPEKKAVEPLLSGEKWITLKPQGPDSDAYVRVKIRQHADGTASVIGGAGGKLNQLRLGKLKSPEEWKARAEERKSRREARQKKRQEQQSPDEQAQEQDAVSAAREYHWGERHGNALATLKTLNDLGIDHGLSEAHLAALATPAPPDAPRAHIQQVEALARAAVKVARAVQRAYEQKLITDHDARAAAQLGDTALDGLGNVLQQGQEHQAIAPGADGVPISSLVKLPSGDWLVSSPGGLDKSYESWAAAARAHAGNVAEHDATTGEPSQEPDFYNPKLWVTTQNEVLPEGFTFDPAAAAKIAALAQQRKEIDRSDKNALKAIQKGQAWNSRKGFDVGAVELDSATAIASLEQDAKTIEDSIVHGQLLDLVGLLDAKKLKEHLGQGGQAKLGEIASDILKTNPVDPALVSRLGHDEAAKLLAYQIRQAVPAAEYDGIVAAQAAHHAEMSTRVAQDAITANQPLLDVLTGYHQRMLAIEAAAGGAPYSPDQVMELDNLAYKSRSLQATLQQNLGITLGQLQASAAMTLALESKPRSLRFAVGGSSADVADLPGLFSRHSGPDETPSIWAHYGLGPDDFSLEDGPDGQLITVKPSGMEKLSAAAVDPEDRAAYDRAIAIKRGDYDEPDFTPAGFAYRPKATFTDLRAEAERFDTRLNYAPAMTDAALEDAIRGYLGARVANGDNPLDVRNDLFSPELYVNLGLGESDSDRLRNAVDALDRDLFKGTKVATADVRRAYQALGDAEAAKQRMTRATDDRQALNSQSLDDEAAIEAAHRTLAAMPMARAALKPLEQLSPQERKFLRQQAITEIMGEELAGPEPDSDSSTTTEPDDDAMGMGSLFGGPVLTPAQQRAIAALQTQRDQLRAQFDGYKISQEQLDDGIAKLNTQQTQIEAGDIDVRAQAAAAVAGTSQWERFSKLLGGDAKAYAAIQDRLKGQFYSRFASAYGAIQGRPILTGQQQLAHVDRVMAASLPEDKREELLAHLRSFQASDMAKVRARQGGKFAVEVDDILEKYEALKGENRQISLLTTETKDQGNHRAQWQRTTLGDAAEQQLDQALAQVMPGFDQLNSAVNLYPEVRFNGDFVAHQRFLKFLGDRKRIGLHASAGAGKSSAMLAAFTHLHGQGQVQRSIVAVPSGIVGQIVGECATFLQPGQYNYSANMGWDREKRIEALKNPDLHLHFTTRESLAADLLHLVEQHTGVSPDDFQNTAARSEDDRRGLMLTALQAEAIDPKSLLFSVDEAHDLSRRQGVAASKRSLALDALAYHSDYYVAATGTPLKNDASEIGDFLQKVGAPEAADLPGFLARYGKNTEANQRSLQRIMAKYAYAVAVKPKTADGQDLAMAHQKPKIPLTTYQKEGRATLLGHYNTLRAWKKANLPKILAAKVARGDTSPLNANDLSSAWDNPGIKTAIAALASDSYSNLSEAQQRDKIGGQLLGASALKHTALKRLYHDAPYEHNAKAQHVVKLAKEMVAQGKPGVVFVASAEAAKMLHEQLAKEGLRVNSINGSMSPEQKTAERLKFSPGQGVEPQSDILIATDAAQTGLNLQRGKFLAHFDIPDTQKAWDQRSARIYRRGQTEDVIIHTLLGDTPEEEIALARMERKGRALAAFQGHNAALGQSEVIDDSGLSAAISQMRKPPMAA